jgi:uncharacterized protein (TIGR02246 family)
MSWIRIALALSTSLVLGAALAHAVGVPAEPAQAPPATAAADPNAADRAAIGQLAAAYVAAFQAEDAKALAAFWTPDGDLTDLAGRTLTGREAIATSFAELFAENQGLTLRIEVGSLRFPVPGTAIEDGVTSVLAPGSSVPKRARYTNTLVRRDGKWLLASVRETAFVPPSNYEHLRPLEWMIGEWKHETPDGHVAMVGFTWSPDGNFLLGKRAVAVGGTLLDNGSERIGWDPAAKVIRSWSFETDGGFGHGTWSQDGKIWRIGTSAVLASGSLMTFSSTITRVDDDTITWQATDHVVDGVRLPDSAVLTMSRMR